jgi:hypothetical protein
MLAGLSPDDRALLGNIIHDACAEAARCNLEMPVTVMAGRLCDFWFRGERDHERLKAAALSAEVIPLLAYRKFSAPNCPVVVSIR